MRDACDTCVLSELFDQLFAASPFPMIMLGEDGVVLAASDDEDANERPGMPEADLPLRLRAPFYLSQMKGNERRPMAQEVDIVRTRPSGDPAHERLYLRRTPWGANLVIVDQTRFRKLQTADVQTARLAALGFMVAGVCHEVTNPLTSLHSIVQLLKAEPHPAPELLHKGLDNISVNVRRILDISRRLVRFSRTGDEPRCRFVLDEILEEALFVLRSDDLLHGIELHYTPDPAAQVFGNPGQVREIFVNLFVNAAQAMGGRGRLEVSTRSTAGMVEVLVRDSGPGVLPEVAARIFEPFFTTRAASNGTGLGLAICAEIAHEHGGRIELVDTAAPGASFRVSLPAEEP
jgi:two-component system, NtrC family, sensor kinase